MSASTLSRWGRATSYDPLGGRPFFMQTIFYMIASIVVAEAGYYIWLLIDKEQRLRQYANEDVNVMQSILEEYHDGDEI